MEIKIKKLVCTKCGWVWTPRGDGVKVCPNCHAYKYVKEFEEEKEG